MGDTGWNMHARPEDRKTGLAPTRLDRDQYFMTIARLVSLRSTCARRTTGCVLINKRNAIVSTGYNGGVPGDPHCIDVSCPGAEDDHTDLTRCQSIHAEINAVLQCRDLDHVHAAYCTESPCMNCARFLLRLPNLDRVYYWDEYTFDAMDMLDRHLRGGVVRINPVPFEVLREFERVNRRGT